MELRAVAVLVVHRHQLGRDLYGFVLDGVAVDARGGRHVEPPGGTDVVGVVDAHEVGLVVTDEGDPGGAVRLVADHQIEVIDPQLLRLGDGGQRLVGREHHRQALGALAVLHLVTQLGRIGGHRNRHVVDVEVLDVAQLADLGVRADPERPHVQLALRRPLPQCLAQQ